MAVFRIVSALGVVALLLYALVAVQRLDVRMPGSGRRMVSVIESTPLPNAASLHVVKIIDEFYVIGRSAGEVSLLCQLPGDSVAAYLAAPDRQRGAAPFTLRSLLRPKARRGVTKGEFPAVERDRTGVR